MRKCIILVLVASSMAATAVAKEGKSIVVQHDATVAGHHITSGTYSVIWLDHNPGATVSFEQKGKIVATAEGKVVDRSRKSPSNEIFYGMAADGSRKIQEIHFRGSAQAIVFSE